MKLSSFVSFPSVTTIGEYCFMNSSIVSASFPLLKKLPKGAFCICVSLTTIDTPNVESIESLVFSTTNLQDIEIESVKTISADAFQNCHNLNRIVFKNLLEIPSALSIPSAQIIDFGAARTLSNSTFSYQRRIVQLNLSSVTEVPSSSFIFCTSLQSVSLLSATYIGDSAFQFCTSLLYLELPKVETVGRNSFSSCISLDYIYLLNVKSIADSAFSDCLNLITLDILYCNKLGGEVFSGCTNLHEIHLRNLMSINNTVFKGLVNIEYVELLGIKVISTNLFANLTKLKTVHINDATVVSSNSFDGCVSLSEVIMPNVVEIHERAFQNCENLAFPNQTWEKLLTCDSNAFKNCYKFVEINFPVLNSLGSEVFKNIPIKHIQIPNLESTGDSFLADIQIELDYSPFDNLKYIGKNCFKNNSLLKEIRLPNLIETDTGTFSDCVNLLKVELPMLTNVSSSSFENCISIENFSSDSITSIGSKGFYGCKSLKNIEFPNLRRISSKTFSNCVSLKSIEFPKLIITETNCFEKCTSLESISLPIIVDVAQEAFSYCTSLKHVNLPNLSSPSRASFQYCTSLETINLPKGTPSCDYLFLGCVKLVNFSFCYIDFIAEGSFKDCISLEAINFSTNFINALAFDNCTSLKSVSLPTATSIDSYAFRYCLSLVEINISTVVTFYGDGQFYGCKNLTTVTLGSLQKVPERSLDIFYGCSSLKRIDLNSSEPGTFNDYFLNNSGIEKIVVHQKLVFNATLCLPHRSDYAQYKSHDRVWKQLNAETPNENDYLEICIYTLDEKTKDTPVMEIALGVVGGVLLIALVPTVVVLILKYRRNKREREKALYLAISAIDD
ncbi:surface antigen BspA-like [Histomonas meleagridis]|uniref:surface antigen BspA-like n=1 Tax=Histomonas meleagridis TaxID=135588 RepID=UPI00355A182C|nr:surface antigen BspA-like [Histomonas meleagridis]KAH0805581.1 surface antigen BspA-like [Histomonas meleagridis]